MEFIAALMLAAGVLWLFYSKTGQAILGTWGVLILCALFPPLLIVVGLVWLTKAEGNAQTEHDAHDVELKAARGKYPNSYRHPRSGQLIVMD
jgi:hypothetical protein